jgi:hypothetical protein
MNLVSWTNGDVEITDYPKCSDEVLAQMVQTFNDDCCHCVMERDTWSCEAHKSNECMECDYDTWDYHVMVRAGESDEGDRICPEHAVIAIGLGYRTVGTGGWSEISGFDVWLDIAEAFDPLVDKSLLISVINMSRSNLYSPESWAAMSDERRDKALFAQKRDMIRSFMLGNLGYEDQDEAGKVAHINKIIDLFYEHTGLAPEKVESDRINEAARKMASV